MLRRLLKVGCYLAGLVELAVPCHAAVLLNQTSWSSGTRTTQNLPTASAWFSSSSGSLSVSSSQLRMIAGASSGAAITYFTDTSNSPPVTLNVGDTLTATILFTFNGVHLGGSSSQGFRLAFANSANASNNPLRVSADGAPFSSGGQGSWVEGYGLFQKMYGAFSDDQPIDIRKRTNLPDPSLLGTSGDWTSLAKDHLDTSSFSGFADLTQYSFQTILQRTNLSSAVITMTWSNLSNGATLSDSAVDNLATNFSFDTIEFRPANNTQAPTTNLFQQVKVEVTSAPVAPSILTQPQDATANSGQAAAFGAVVNGTLPLSVQWFHNTNTLVSTSTIDFPPAHTPIDDPSLTLVNVQAPDAGGYILVVTNSYGSVTSSVATLTVTLAPPSITNEPEDLTVIPGQSATFSVLVAGSEPLTYQWYYNTNSLLTDVTNSTLVLTSVQPSDAGSYSVLVSNPVGTAMSSNAVLTVNTNPVAPVFITQPFSQGALPGDNVSFVSAAVGTQPITYQWNTNGFPISGATSNVLNLLNVQAANTGNYTVVAANNIGSTTSDVAVLSVFIQGPPPLPVIPTNQYNILNFGGYGNGTSNNADAIQSTINTAAEAGGGTVIIPANGTLSTYMCGPIALSNSINLQVNSGVTLKMLPRFATPSVTNWPSPNFPLIDASGAHDVAITGSGTIDGNAGFGSTNWWQTPTLDESKRPKLINFHNGCSNVLVQGVTLQNSPVFHILMKGGNANITIDGVTWNTPGNSPNTDGMDIGSTSVLIQNCTINVGDDNVQMGSSGDPAANIVISNCTFGTGHGVSIGGPTQRGVRDVIVSNCTFNGTANGIRIKTDRDIGGVVENLKYLDITMTNVGYPLIVYMYYDTIGTPNNINPTYAAGVSPQPIVDTTPFYRNITISNLTASGLTGSTTAGILWGRPESLVSNVTLYNVNFAAPTKVFNIYQARGVRIINSNLTAPNTTTNTLNLYNAEVTITNSAANTNLITLAGLAKPLTNNVLSFFNARAAITQTNVLDPNPLLTLSKSSLAVSNSLNLGVGSTLNFGLSPIATRIDAGGNLSLSGTLNITDAGGFSSGTYTLFTYTGTLVYSGLNLGSTPAGYVYTIDTGTVGQVKLIVSLSLSAFEQWQIAYFGSTNDPSATASADPDGDGQNNQAEFFSGSVPTNSSSALRINSVVRSVNDISVTWLTVGGHTNILQVSSGTANGSYTNDFADIAGSLTIVPGSGDTSTNYVDIAGATNAPSRYYRVRLVP
jgi:polygalacturonase